ncbi:MAG: hypothetical protein COA88_07085 [Kordia sp.]|nr:MAG: hypothetical protein COA88_07085 [Kordia sp.]
MRFYRVLIAMFFISVLTLLSCKKEKKQEVIPTEIGFKYEGNLQLLDSINTVIKKIKIEIADNDFERQTGLMYRKQMDNNKGMLFIFDKSEIKSFYMKNTYIPLDIIYIDANNTIINIVKNAEPLNETSLFSDAPAKYVLEINAGLSDIWGIKKGYKINYSKL